MSFLRRWLWRSGLPVGDAWPETGTADPHLEPDAAGMARLAEAIDLTDWTDERLLVELYCLSFPEWHTGVFGQADARAAVRAWLRTARGQEVARRMEFGNGGFPTRAERAEMHAAGIE